MIPLKDVVPSRTTALVVRATLTVTAIASLLWPIDSAADPSSLFSWFLPVVVQRGPVPLAVALLYLWVFGDSVEDRLGHARFLLFYVACGLVAALVMQASTPGQIASRAGASSAVAGVIGGYMGMYPRSSVLTMFPAPPWIFEVPAVFFVGLWFVIQFASGLSDWAAQPGTLPGGAPFWAQAASFAAGAALVRLMRHRERDRVEWWGP